jgi:hypothetical protein
MLKPAVAVLVILALLAVAFVKGSVLLADLDDSIELAGYEFRLRVKAELLWTDRTPQMTTPIDSCRIAPDSLEAQ